MHFSVLFIYYLVHNKSICQKINMYIYSYRLNGNGSVSNGIVVYWRLKWIEYDIGCMVAILSVIKRLASIFIINFYSII